MNKKMPAYEVILPTYSIFPRRTFDTFCDSDEFTLLDMWVNIFGIRQIKFRQFRPNFFLAKISSIKVIAKSPKLS